MNTLSTRGILLVTVLLVLAACGTGNRLDTDTNYGNLQSAYDQYEGRGAGVFLPTINRVDSGVIPLENGELVGTGQLLIDGVSGARIAINTGTVVRHHDSHYDEDLDGDLDFIVVALRPLSAHAAANVTAYRAANKEDQVNPAEFIKVGGIALEPHGATFEPFVQIAMPVHPIGFPETGKTYDLYRFTDGSVSGRATADDIGTDTGWWEYIGTAEVKNPPEAQTETSAVHGASQSPYYVVFEISYNAEVPEQSFGQYCIVVDSVPIDHNGGDGGDL